MCIYPLYLCNRNSQDFHQKLEKLGALKVFMMIKNTWEHWWNWPLPLVSCLENLGFLGT